MSNICRKISAAMASSVKVLKLSGFTKTKSLIYQHLAVWYGCCIQDDVISLIDLAEKFEGIAAEAEASAIALDRVHSQMAEKFFMEAKRLRERAEQLRNPLPIKMKP
jgi:hypothetical protein